MEANYFEVGKTKVAINLQLAKKESDERNKLVPEDFLFLVEEKGEKEDQIEKVLKGIQMNFPVLLIGPTGSGKTSIVRYLAHKTHNAYRRIQLNGSTGVDNFVGRWLINDKGTYWQDGILTSAMRTGEFLLVDEINAALPEILFILHSVMDDEHSLILDEKGNEIVKPHPDFRLFAAMNPSEDYAGTKELNRALVDRFPIVLEIPYPKPEEEKAIVSAHTGLSDVKTKTGERSILTRMVELANTLRKMNEDKTMVFTCSTRQLIYWGKLIENYGVKKAAQITLVNKADVEDREKIQDELNKLFKNSETI